MFMVEGVERLLLQANRDVLRPQSKWTKKSLSCKPTRDTSPKLQVKGNAYDVAETDS